MFQAVERAIVAEGMCAADAASFVSVCPHVSGCRGRHGWCSLMLRMGRDVCQVLVDERLLAFECLPLATLERALDDGRLPSKYLSLGLLRLATGLRKELTQTKAQLQSAQHRLLQPYECCDPHERIGERIAVLRGSDYHQGIVLGFRAPDHRIAFDGDVNGATLVDLRQVQYRGPAAAPATGRGIGLTPCCVMSPVSPQTTHVCLRANDSPSMRGTNDEGMSNRAEIASYADDSSTGDSSEVGGLPSVVDEDGSSHDGDETLGDVGWVEL